MSSPAVPGPVAPAAGAGWGAGSRAAGIVVALGYLTGLVRGPVVAVVGGFALITLGRCAAASRRDDLFLGGALAVVAGAVGVGALRWGALDLGDVRGAQAVLGPTLLVGPAAAAAACWVAALAAVSALAAWLASARAADRELPGDGGRIVHGLWIAEAAVGALAIVSVFWGPSLPRGSFGGGDSFVTLAGWALAATVVAGGAVYLARLIEERPPAWRTAGLVAAGAATLVAAATVVGTIS